MHHVVVMTATGSLGLVAIFIVDALNLFYISRLGQRELAAAIGFAGTLQFFVISVSIGFTIATSALVSRSLGREARAEAAGYGGAALIFMVVTSSLISAAVWPFLDPLVGLLGATGETRIIATGFLQIVIPSTPVMALGMATTGILRGTGDARRAMYVTLAGGFAAAILDPILIFGFDLGVTGAAISTVLSRVVLVAIGLHGAIVVHNLARMPGVEELVKAVRPFFVIGVPAVLTQLATPVGNAYVTAEIARFGDSAVAGWAVIGRLVPVAFGVIFALSGAVGPIMGQNYGAQRFDRVSQTLRDSLKFTLFYVLGAWALLALGHNGIATLFDADETARELIAFFCLFAAGSFLFNGALFVANAAFNNLGYATYATMMNWGRSTLGVIPFVWVGSTYYGAKGVLAGWGLGAVAFGIAAMALAFRTTRAIEERGASADAEPLPAPPAAQSPFTSGKGSTIG
ncbi:MAG: MATE family efflux transporter [Brucellaceae bacterium]|nr:MATE family efflux transporter [Brucellaceae bacterium]